MADNPLAYLGSKLEQIAYVVEDFDESMEFFKASLGIERFYIWDHITREQTEKIYRGGPGVFEFSACGCPKTRSWLVRPHVGCRPGCTSARTPGLGG